MSAPRGRRRGQPPADPLPRRGRPGKPGRVLLLGLGAAALLAWALGQGAPAAERKRRLALPTPGVTALDPMSREQIAHAFQAAQAADGPAEERGQAYGELGQVLMAYDLPGAEGAMLMAAELAPSEHRWPYYLAHLQASRGAADAAVASLERALALRPDDISTLLRLAETRLDRAEPAAAAPLIDRALKADPSYFWSHALAARLAVARRDWPAAAAAYERALSLEPTAVMLNRPLSQVYFELGLESRARAALAAAGSEAYALREPLIQELEELRVGHALFLRRAAQRLGQGRPAEALELLERARALDETDPELWLYLTSARYDLGQRQEALAAARGGLALAPPGPMAAKLLRAEGLVLYELGQPDQAEERLRRAMGLAAEDDEVVLALARLLRRAGRCGEAIGLYGAVVRRRPDQREAAVELAMCRDAGGDRAGARAAMEAAATAYPDDAAVRDALGRLAAAGPDGPAWTEAELGR